MRYTARMPFTMGGTTYRVGDVVPIEDDAQATRLARLLVADVASAPVVPVTKPQPAPVNRAVLKNKIKPGKTGKNRR